MPSRKPSPGLGPPSKRRRDGLDRTSTPQPQVPASSTQVTAVGSKGGTAPRVEPTEPVAAEAVANGARIAFETCDPMLDIDRLVAAVPEADADLVRTIVAAHAQLSDRIVPKASASHAVVAPLLVALRALEHALVLATTNASVAAKSRRRLVSAAALIVITGGASDGVMNKLLDVSPVAHAVQRTLTSFVPIYRAARTTREVRTLWDTISVVLSPLLPRLPNLEEGARRLLIQAAVRAFLPRAHPKRTPGEWPTHMRALLKAGGIDVGEGDSLKVSLHNYQKTLTDYR
jgi:hypothetical protein